MVTPVRIGGLSNWITGRNRQSEVDPDPEPVLTPEPQPPPAPAVFADPQVEATCQALTGSLKYRGSEALMQKGPGCRWLESQPAV